MDSIHGQGESSNPLASALVDTIRIAREARHESHSYREILILSIELLKDLDRQLEASRRVNQSLREELRRYTSGYVTEGRAA